ncbi:hypothetical protein Mapa_004100 [Marchantia paleacea]|nr:hypothetical protein Mapa_004100 [Marchantia paleacea]
MHWFLRRFAKLYGRKGLSVARVITDGIPCAADILTSYVVNCLVLRVGGSDGSCAGGVVVVEPAFIEHSLIAVTKVLHDQRVFDFHPPKNSIFIKEQKLCVQPIWTGRVFSAVPEILPQVPQSFEIRVEHIKDGILRGMGCQSSGSSDPPVDAVVRKELQSASTGDIQDLRLSILKLPSVKIQRRLARLH